jgi:hypothetical protein
MKMGDWQTVSEQHANNRTKDEKRKGERRRRRRCRMSGRSHIPQMHTLSRARSSERRERGVRRGPHLTAGCRRGPVGGRRGMRGMRRGAGRDDPPRSCARAMGSDAHSQRGHGRLGQLSQWRCTAVRGRARATYSVEDMSHTHAGFGQLNVDDGVAPVIVRIFQVETGLNPRLTIGLHVRVLTRRGNRLGSPLHTHQSTGTQGAVRTGGRAATHERRRTVPRWSMRWREWGSDR